MSHSLDPTCKTLGCAKEVETCHAGSEQDLHQHSARSGLEFPPAFSFTAHRSCDLIVMKWGADLFIHYGFVNKAFVL